VSDETTPFILGDAAAAELNRYRQPKWWRKKKSRPPLTHCENCGAPLTGPYCSQCGQPAIDYRRSFASLMIDAADAFFNLDERFLATFWLLLIKPWRLTIEFIEGKRARHVHPLRVYLIASVIFFLVINFLSRNAHFQTASTGKGTSALVIGTQTPTPSPIPFPMVEPTPRPFISFNFSPTPSPTAAPKAEPDADEIFAEFDRNNDVSSFGKWAEERARTKLGPSGARGDLFLKALIANLAPMVLCCIPLFALVLKILYIFKRRFYIEHLVFALHTHAFVFLSTVAIIGLGFFIAWKGPAPLVPITCAFLGLAVLIQLQIAIRKVYRQNWFATLFKFALGTLIYLFLLGIAFGITAFVTLLLP
jgi:hypothetical protein